MYTTVNNLKLERRSSHLLLSTTYVINLTYITPLRILHNVKHNWERKDAYINFIYIALLFHNSNMSSQLRYELLHEILMSHRKAVYEGNHSHE